MNDRSKRAASEDPNPQSPVCQRTSTSEESPSPDVPDGLPAPGSIIHLGQSDGQRTTYRFILETPPPNSISAEIILSVPETQSPTPGDAPEAEDESQEEEKQLTAPTNSTPPEVPEVKMELPKDEDKPPKFEDERPKDKDKLSKEKDKSSKGTDESPEVK
ncbi:uncharacterized protein FIESC28_10252 [Fusarium coffeatum]|uniref:Uncharacterized protein n=1 Tax=Fusarium coffeatum TaxID=231269 RepID=A0A366QUR2_9HYPO|nr:uncharacterized protein FIESC28_10252 [Fusarium coffeatum]RBR08452.1 hypothetical protein FIESC28_10252 [Fusarium coffeatum]